MEKKLICPRCGETNVKDYGKIIECLDCDLEFFKDYIENIDDKTAVLSIQEMKKIVEEFKKPTKKEREFEKDLRNKDEKKVSK